MELDIKWMRYLVLLAPSSIKVLRIYRKFVLMGAWIKDPGFSI